MGYPKDDGGQTDGGQLARRRRAGRARPRRGQRHRLPGSGAAELLTLAVFPDVDHRIQTGNPLRLAYGYLETLTSFVLQASA
jgi:hypothetical protein